MERADVDYRMIFMWSWSISGVTRLVYGLIVLGIVVFMALITAADMMYINNPTIQSEIKRTIDGRRIGGLRLVSLDALRSVEEAYTQGKTAMQLYLVYRIKSYMIATSTLVILVGGGDTLIPMATKVVTAILKTAGLV